MDLQLRSSTDGSFDTEEWLHAVTRGFLRAPRMPEKEVAEWLARSDRGRLRGAFAGDRCVATYRSFDQRLTVPGGTDVPAHAVTGVTVSPGHRRRGLLTRMMTADLAEAKEGGEMLSTLIAAEHGIYGRFGYGPATVSAAYTVEGSEAGLPATWTLPEAEGVVDFHVDGSVVRSAGPELFERFRLLHPGAVSRPARWWGVATGEIARGPEWREPWHVLFRDAEGTVQGMAAFTTDRHWDRGVPDGTATVDWLVATTPTAERALWSAVLSMDWVRRVRADRLPPDALLPDLLPNPRAARVTEANDFLWIRPLDVPAMLRSRGYAVEGELVLEVTDPLGLAGGRFLLTAGPDGADCVPTGRGADLTLDTTALGTLYLGDRPASRLLALGRLAEETPGAVHRADLLLAEPRRAWTPDVF
ncbi:GNAT family N-acetyltransferase [Streptomyces bohaiensis]|uniref:GNAT family N-acetyltransferase n=1 Tax=Streptomyces bohaiensis TaxID=1431344 RepID=A0ABX1CBB9_9ACTN|nr:GNAT family N-acetyltransferase [Streptomyces bohaiensis]NJQ14935.1 GNAT family N-acetyltransferase [Streptomyces bohaiensis]